jgi:microcin C transport system substrate-binding protein
MIFKAQTIPSPWGEGVEHRETDEGIAISVPLTRPRYRAPTLSQGRGVVFAFLLLFTMTTIASASDPTHAIAMHGTPKHDAGFTYLPYANPNATQGGTFTQCAIGTFDTLNDNTIKGKPAQGLHLLNDPLMRRVWDEPFGLYGVIAKTVTMPDDRSSITFTLNSNAQFHDGTAITTDDVQYSFDTLKTKGKPNTRNVYSTVKNVNVADKHTITFEFDDTANRETPMILAMMPIYSKAHWDAREFNSTTLDIPLGNGPYKIKSIDEGKKITFEKIADYWARKNPVHIGHYNFDQMVFDYYRDEQVALEAFKSGECDIRREANPAKWQVNYAQDDKYIREELRHSRPERTRGFIMNTRRAPLNDIRVRQALNLAFDFDWMNTSLLHGKTKQINSTFSNSILANPTNYGTANKRENLKQAADLMTQAGWPLKDNKRFELSFILNNPAEEKIALGYARDLKRLGVTLNIRTLDTSQFFGALNDYDYDIVSWRWVNSLSPGTEQSIYWGCDAANTQGSRNYAGVCDAGIDAEIGKLSNAIDYDSLTTHAKTLDKLIMDQHLFIPLYYTGVDYVARWPQINRPDRQSLYGSVMETWWRE